MTVSTARERLKAAAAIMEELMLTALTASTLTEQQRELVRYLVGEGKPPEEAAKPQAAIGADVRTNESPLVQTSQAPHRSTYDGQRMFVSSLNELWHAR
jgi:hypothetical protein